MGTQKKQSTPRTAVQLCNRIAAVHRPPEWACFFEVGNTTGYAVSRYADAVAMALWPSRGLIIRGFEIKTSRADYKREAAQPLKAESIAKYCDEWWIVAPPNLISDPETEMPPAWGLMVSHGKTLRTVRKATRTEAEPLSRGFVAAVLRRAHEMVAEKNSGWVRREDVQEEIDRAYESGKKDAPRDVQHFKDLSEHYKERIVLFKELTGLDLMEGGYGGYTGNVKDISLYYRTGRALLGKYRGDVTHLFNTVNNVEKATKQIRENLVEIKDIWAEAEKE